MRLAHIVVGQGRGRHAGAVGVDRGSPAEAVHFVVVGAGVAGAVRHAGVVVVGRHEPGECRHAHFYAEAEVLGGVVHAAGAVEPYALEVEGHVDFVAGVGVVAIDPEFVVGAVDAFHPHFVEEDVGLDFVVVSAVDHDFALRVEVVDGAGGLAVGEVVDGPSGSSQAHQDHNYNNCNSFHKALLLFVH